MALVIKVKYEGTLRRFNVYAKEDGILDLSLDALRSKICELFQFNPNAQLVITYTDEDNDIVTMADDSDLFDALHQGLNPLRLEVTWSESLTPRDSTLPKEQVQPFDLRSICSDETLKLLPEPLQKALMKCSKDPFVNVVASTPAVSEGMKGLIRLASTHLGPLMEGKQTCGASGGTQANNTDSPPMKNLVDQNTCNIQLTPQDLLGPSAPPASMKNPVDQNTCNIQLTPQDLSGPSAPPASSASRGNGLKRNLGDNMLRTFHKGVQCDSCGMSPIIGPRYKSTVKEDYDLCHGCFCEIGNDNEYTRIDRALYRPPRFCRERLFHGGSPFHKPSDSFPFSRGTPTPHALASAVGKPANKPWGKLDCRFVQDVTIFDGTQLAPGTPFTKIWRLRNNGTLRWPPHTQLVRVGGDELGAGNAVNLEIQEQGYPVDEELDAAVDFIAPMQPGRYASYWRLMAPSGQKFGQRVWVLIQVEARTEDLLPHLMESLLTLKDLNQNNTVKGKMKQNMADVDVSMKFTDEKACVGEDKMNLDPEDVHTELGAFSIVEQAGRKSSFLPVGVTDASRQVQQFDVPTKEQGASSMTIQVVPSSLGTNSTGPVKAVPDHDAPEGHVTVNVSAPFLVRSETYSPLSSASYGASKQQKTLLSVGTGASDINEVEQSLLHELEDMGFNQITLNAELLRKNNYDLQKTVDDLCSAAQWDTILEELQEMGFCDSEMNKSLLLKNEGSVKRVVLDLLSAEKVASSMQSQLSKKAKQN
eukprot:Gb_08608 [translate_table: standard]